MKPKKGDLVVDADHYPSLSLLLVTLQRVDVKHPPLLCRSLNPVHIFLHVYPRANVPLFIHVEVSHIWRLAHALWHHFLAPDFNETPPCKRCLALVFVGQNPHSVLPSPNQYIYIYVYIRVYIYIGWLHTHILLELYSYTTLLMGWHSFHFVSLVAATHQPKRRNRKALEVLCKDLSVVGDPLGLLRLGAWSRRGEAGLLASRGPAKKKLHGHSHRFCAAKLIEGSLKWYPLVI
jgi:hypothetical protein